MTAKPKRKFNWAIPGLLAMILIIVGIATAQSLSAASPAPDKLATTCGSCHTMDQQVHSWQESSHKDVACTACHADKGALGWAEMQYHRLQMVFSERDGHTDLAKVATNVPNERCIECHARQMPWVMQDLKPAKLDDNGQPIRPARNELAFLPAQAGHDLHLTLEQPLQCTSCHTGVSHGPADKPDLVEDWHGICLDCHAEQKVAVAAKTSIACSACHVDLEKVAPQSHKDPNFAASAHGKEARSDINSCTQCHLNPGISGQTALGPHTLVPASLTTTAATQSQAAMDLKLVPQFPPGSLKVPEGMKDDCAACHGITMPHPNDWLKQHATGYQEKPELCATCHGARDGGGNLIKGDPKTLPTTDPKCVNCHAQPMPHPADYLENQHAAQAQANPAACQQCHSDKNPVNPNAKYATPQFCKDCHLNEFRHASGYTLKHKDVLAAYGNNLNAAGCTQCHSTVQGGTNSCTTCHTGGVGQKTQWHPEDFVATHKDKLAGQDYTAAGCAQCHTAVQSGTNTCTACHTSGLGKKTQWHPEGWWVTHAQTTTIDNKASCEKCHAYVEPSCSKCHSKF